jgi:hypothetical protein
MLTPTAINIVYFFYPIGNTPAVCLTQDLPCEQRADILLLGCGDVRNILFTTYSDSEFSQSASFIKISMLNNALQSHVELTSHVATSSLQF